MPTCGPCHVHKAFIYVVENNTPSTFTFNDTTGKWVNNYSANAADAIGEIGCFTCHSSLHTTYGMSDIALTTVAPVPMTMWGGSTKPLICLLMAVSSNLCAKCHQPRPLTATAAYDPATRLINYDSLKNQPALMFYDTTAGAKNIISGLPTGCTCIMAPSAPYMPEWAALNFPDRTYDNSPHTAVASCQDCHMAQPMTVLPADMPSI